jgi:outer membrane protein assembly factor BamD
VAGRFVAAVALVVVAAGCSTHKQGLVPQGNTQPDRYLFDKGTDALNNKKWLTAREFFKQVVETYTQSPYRPDAKLGLGDTYLGENTAESIVMAINEFTEFLSFYPTNKRADYAQYKLGMAHFKQMRAPQRDQTETKEAIKAFQTFIDRYPQSASGEDPAIHESLMTDVRSKLRQAKDRLSTANYDVGYFYYRLKWYPGAIARFKEVLTDDPDFTNRDAVYFYLAQSYVKLKLDAEALPLLEKLVAEFEQSQYLIEARKLIATLKADAAKTTGGLQP